MTGPDPEPPVGGIDCTPLATLPNLYPSETPPQQPALPMPLNPVASIYTNHSHFAVAGGWAPPPYPLSHTVGSSMIGLQPTTPPTLGTPLAAHSAATMSLPTSQTPMTAYHTTQTPLAASSYGSEGALSFPTYPYGFYAPQVPYENVVHSPVDAPVGSQRELPRKIHN